VIRGIADTDQQLIESSRLMRLSSIFQIIFLYLPSTLLLLGTGMRLSASRAFGTAVTAGIVAGTPGLGARLYMAQANSEVSKVFAYVFAMGVTGVLIYSLFTSLENRLFKWKVSV
jgi:nitrate/nitrite transport system permease protein